MRSFEPVRSTIPYPVWAVPGSIPRTINLPRRRWTSRRGGLGQDLAWQVEVGGHALYVVEVLERLDQSQILPSHVLADLDRGLGLHRDLRRLDLDAGRLQALAKWLKIAGIGHHLDRVGLRVDVVGASVDGHQRDVVGVYAVTTNRNNAA